MQDIAYMFASPDDAEEIKRLLTRFKLPTGGIAPHIQNFLLTKTADGLVGVIGLETYDHIGLLRSFAVLPEARGNGVGMELYTRIVEHARSLGMNELYLLTTTAEDYFAKLDFQKVSRKTIPPPMLASVELKGACPATAVCMKLRLV